MFFPIYTPLTARPLRGQFPGSFASSPRMVMPARTFSSPTANGSYLGIDGILVYQDENCIANRLAERLGKQDHCQGDQKDKKQDLTPMPLSWPSVLTLIDGANMRLVISIPQNTLNILPPLFYILRIEISDYSLHTFLQATWRNPVSHRP